MADSLYLKDNLAGFVPAEASYKIFEKVQNGSALLKLANVEEMTTDKKTFTVQADTPGAYWVNEGEAIQTSIGSWVHPEIEVKKVATIIPTTREKLNDTVIDVFGELGNSAAQAIANEIDSQTLFGENVYEGNTKGIFKTSIFGSLPEGHAVARVDGVALDETVSLAMSKVEEADFDVNGVVSSRGLKHEIRNLRDVNNAPYFVQGTNGSEFYGNPITFAGGGFKKDKAEMLLGDWTKAIVGLRQDIEYQVLDQASLTLKDGSIINLAQNDMIALKVTMRIGFLNVKPDAFAAVTPVANS